mmetsp:Transcript_106124/g.129442  ORF Transcript_106124/g.129442 Transcript_106124/m.129442 type:complete len:165 (-) Transcript_106124:88-582(-)
MSYLVEVNYPKTLYLETFFKIKNRKTMLIVGIFAGFVVCITVINAEPFCHGKDCPVYPGCQNYSSYTFALQNWQNGNTWQIHGLWPDYSKTCYPQNCSDWEYNNVTGPLRTEMLQIWNPNSTDPDHFWKHELEVHGVCMAYYEPTKNGNCRNICFDLDFNVISC